MGSRTSSSLTSLGGSSSQTKKTETIRERLSESSSRIFAGVLIDYVVFHQPMVGMLYAGLKTALWAYRTYEKMKKSKNPEKTLAKEGAKYLVGEAKSKVAEGVANVAWNQAKAGLKTEVPVDADVIIKSAIKRTILEAI